MLLAAEARSGADARCCSQVKLYAQAGKIKEMNRALKRFSSIDKVIAPNENWIARQDLEKEGGDKVGRCFKWVVTYGVYVDLGAGRRVDLWSVCRLRCGEEG